MGPSTFALLRLLSDGRFHSGEDLARRLGRSRATVSESLKSAGETGLAVFSVPGRGYRLAAPVEFLDATRIVQALGPAAAGVRLTLVDETDSTNTRLAALAQQGAPSGTCIAAEWQKAGRGRRGRAWQSAPGASIAFSLLWRFERGPGHLAGLSLAVAVAVSQALERCGVAGVGVKWPNDLVAGWKKLGGILVETSGDLLGPTAAVIGVGVNHRLDESLLARIDQPAVDVASLADEPPSRNDLLAALVAGLAGALARFEREGFGAFREAWKARHAYAGRRVTVTAPDAPPRVAEVIDIAEDGALVVNDGGRPVRLTAAEISLRPA
jgi:BirA family biotin operon repressor/biotin-[acetyl-CoA-carboxylase] ligase